MNENISGDQTEGKSQKPDAGHLAFAMVSLFLLCATFVLADSGLEQWVKALGFSAIILLFAAFFWNFFQKQSAIVAGLKLSAGNGEKRRPKTESAGGFDADIESKLQALEEANDFFGASLKSSDMFRLVASRIDEIISFSACALLLADDGRTGLTIKYAVGENAENLTGLEIPLRRGLAGKVFAEREPGTDNQLLLDKVVISQKALEGFQTAAAVPLFRGTEVFGVLELFSKDERVFDETSLKLLSAVGERFAPLFLSSTAFEKSISSALTDSLTNLPNERAFFLVIENQIAESQRFPDERPLTVLALDIKNFAEINEKFGHAAGNDILSFTARMVKNGLRRMDFLARSASDEFLAILPTASEEIGREVIERLDQAFQDTPFEVSPEFKITIRLNFGLATFWKDGETPNQLLKTAYLRKQEMKSSVGSRVIWFPKS